MIRLLTMSLAVASAMLLWSTNTSAQVKHLQTERSAIATAVWAGDTLYVSGQLPTPTTPADTAGGIPAVYGSTQEQTESALMKIEAILREQGLGFRDVVMMHVFLVGDPTKGGTLDFAGMMAAYTRHFGTTDQPNKPARSAMQVSALAAAGALVEIEVIAVRPG
ncbi:MAG: Rid family hydrolase [Vicinamibacterales bacterium]